MTDTTDWKAESERLRRERDELAARLAKIEAQVVSAMTREDAALLCEEVSSDLIAAMMRQGVDQDEARSLTAAARLCASEIRAGYVAARETAAPAAAPEQAEPCRSDTTEEGARIENLPLSARAKNALRAEGVETLGRLSEMSKWDLMKIPNIGKTTALEIIGFLQKKSEGGAIASPRPCRCGPDGCSDSTSCPRGER